MHVLEQGTELADPLAPYAAVDRSKPDGTPWVMGHMVGGLDGSAAVGGRVGDLSTAPDASLFIAMRAIADVVLVGAETVRREGYGGVRLSPERLAVRRAEARSDVPAIAIVSRSLDFDWSAKVFTAPASDARTIVITCAAAPAHRRAQAEQVAEVITAGDESVLPGMAIDELGRLGHRIVLCEGGPTWLGDVVAAGVLDELCLTIAPFMGGDALPVSVTPPGAALARFKLRHVGRDGDSMFLRYERPSADER